MKARIEGTGAAEFWLLWLKETSKKCPPQAKSMVLLSPGPQLARDAKVEVTVRE